MHDIIRAAGAALILSGIASAAKGQAGAGKIVYVNTQALMEAAPGRAAADSQLQKEGEGYRTQIQKMQDSINKLLTKYQKDESTLSATAKDTKQKEIQTLETEFQAKQQQFQQQFQQHSTEVMAPITDAVKKVLDDIRAEEGYSMIIANDPGNSILVSADKNLDITDKVVSRLRTVAVNTKTAPTTKAGAPGSPAGVTRPKPPTQ